jgi:nitrite reductase (NADH) large subunit
VHANIQKDGTYSVVPRMWGGMTNPKELRAIADVVDKFAIPMVKVTGGQRIDLLGIHKEDLPAVWADLGKAGFISGRRLCQGPAHGEDLRRLRLVPLRHAGFHRPRYPHREVHVGLLDAGKGQARCLRLSRAIAPKPPARISASSASIVRLRDPFRRRRGLDIKGTELLGLAETEDEALEHHRGVDAALSRAGPLSRAHL